MVKKPKNCFEIDILHLPDSFNGRCTKSSKRSLDGLNQHPVKTNGKLIFTRSNFMRSLIGFSRWEKIINNLEDYRLLNEYPVLVHFTFLFRAEWVHLLRISFACVIRSRETFRLIGLKRMWGLFSAPPEFIRYRDGLKTLDSPAFSRPNQNHSQELQFNQSSLIDRNPSMKRLFIKSKSPITFVTAVIQFVTITSAFDKSSTNTVGRQQPFR